MSRHQQQIDYVLKGKIKPRLNIAEKKIIGWFRRYGSTNLFHNQLDFCFTSDFLCIIFQGKFSLCKWRRNIYLALMYFLEKLLSSVVIFGDLGSLIAIYLHPLWDLCWSKFDKIFIQPRELSDIDSNKYAKMFGGYGT